MHIPLQITFRDMERSDAVEKAIREKTEKLEQFSEIMSCRVVVQMINKHQHKGTMYHISADITVPGGGIVVSRDHGIDHSHEDIYVAIRDCFNAARRQLQDHQRKSHQKVKAHEVPPHGRITDIFAEEGYGRIETPDGRSIYFHQNSVLKDEFSKLEVGSEVRYSEEQGDEGPQASSVQLVGKHHIAG
jgi:ribosomal subunit interface protein